LLQRLREVSTSESSRDYSSDEDSNSGSSSSSDSAQVDRRRSAATTRSKRVQYGAKSVSDCSYGFKQRSRTANIHVRSVVCISAAVLSGAAHLVLSSLVSSQLPATNYCHLANPSEHSSPLRSHRSTMVHYKTGDDTIHACDLCWNHISVLVFHQVQVIVLAPLAYAFLLPPPHIYLRVLSCTCVFLVTATYA